MELLTILLSSFLAIISPVGFIVEHVVESRLRSQLEAVEELEVRIDNAPNYQILQGKVEKIRVASRGVEPIPDFRIAVLEFETDPIDLDVEQLRQGERSPVLEQPLQGGVRLVLTEADLNRALQSPRLQSYLQQRLSRLSRGLERYEVLNPRLDLLNDNRVRLQLGLAKSGEQTLTIALESGIEVIEGHRFRLIDPKGTIDGRPLSSRLLQGIAQGLSDRFDLQNLEKTGMTLRLLQLEIDNHQINGAAFVRVEAGSLNPSLN